MADWKTTPPDDPAARRERLTPPASLGAAGTESADSGSLHRLLVQTVSEYAIFALDVTGHILTWNVGAERLKGYTRDEIVGRHFSAFYPPEEIAAGHPQHELEVAAREGKYEEEGWRLRKDGTYFWANVVITALRDETGTLVGFAKVTRDLTQRRRAEQTLRESEERFRALVQGVKDYAIFMLTPDGRIASWNAGAERLKGYAPEEIIGRHFSTFYPAEEVAAGKPQRELEIAVETGKYEEEGWRVRKDGSYFWASVLITAIRGESGKLIGFAKVTRDLTERRAAQERAIADARRIADVEAANRTKSEFLTALSHELRTPINATMGYAELIEMGIGGPVTEQQREYLARVRGSQEHLLGIINDLLNYSRIESGQVRYDLAPVRVHDVVAAVLPMVEPQALARELALHHGPCDVGAIAQADRAKAEQIVLNLLSNAVKFTPPGGSVTVGCGVVDHRAVITVADSGPGIHPEQQTAVFEPFVQLGRTLTSGHGGTGLGLAISRDLARAMGGDVTVESEVGVGSTFTLWLPLA
jgi:PAS domain S-box-containing protein